MTGITNCPKWVAMLSRPFANTNFKLSIEVIKYDSCKRMEEFRSPCLYSLNSNGKADLSIIRSPNRPPDNFKGLVLILVGLEVY